MSKVNVFLFEVQSGVSNKSGKAYRYQELQVLQSPQAPDVLTRQFVQDGTEPHAAGKYLADIVLRNSPTGVQVLFKNLEAV